MEMFGAGVTFVNSFNAGAKPGRSGSRTVKSHVRRAVLYEIKHGKQKKFKFFTRSKNATPQPGKRSGEQHQGVLHDSEEARNLTTYVDEAKAVAFKSTVGEALDQDGCSGHVLPEFQLEVDHGVPPAIRAWHPYTVHTSLLVHVPQDMIDSLFKSRGFQLASEPIFDAKHIDSPNGMPIVLPGCLKDAGFLNALLYSSIVCAGARQQTKLALKLKSQAIRSLRSTLTEDITNRSAAYTVLMLKGAAYHQGDIKELETHSLGLQNLLRANRIEAGNALNLAIFWLDLFAAMIVGSERRYSTPWMPGVSWQRHYADIDLLPAGFVHHQSELPLSVLDCIRDVLEVQNLVLINQTASDVIENMQAHIEDRLVACKSMCAQLGPVPEATRIATLICIYASFMSTWNNTQIPVKMSEKLLEVLQASMQAWDARMDLLMWLALIGSSTAAMDANKLVRQWAAYLQNLRDHICAVVHPTYILASYNRALVDFIYYPEGLHRRWIYNEWHEFHAMCG